MSPRPIRVTIVDDHPALRDGTALLLAEAGDIEVVARLSTLNEVRARLEKASDVDVLVLDIRLAGERGLELLAERSLHPDWPAVVIWTGFDLPQYARYAFELGAAGFVLKTDPVDELVDAVRVAAAGGVRFRDLDLGHDRLPTPRECEVLAGIVAGRSNDEIAADLGIASRTVESHLTRLYQRYDVQSRAELAVRAVQEGWLEAFPGA